MIPKSCRLFGQDHAQKRTIALARRQKGRSMVVLNRIYTRTGDDGTTALGTGERRKKYDLRIACYGTIDETNAAIGLARLATAPPRDRDPGAGDRDGPGTRRGRYGKRRAWKRG